ncbi:MAG: prolipoprotein diacylglyceryl transferase [Flavobacteriales bacterium]|nr:prolipoprotein diacylglyceryl transferase [Flavobacteriales bacterium]
MFPYLSDLTNYLFGFSFSFPLPMFGFMVALAFIAANLLFVKEMKRKEADGLLSPSTIKVMKGEKAKMSDLITNGLFGFLLGYKVLGLLLNYSEVIRDLPGYILSAQGQVLGGIAGAALLAFLKYREAEKQRLPEPKEVEETVRPFQHVSTMTFIAAIGGILGAKLFDAVEDLDRLAADPMGVIFSASGLSIYGGLIVGGGSVVYYAYKKKLKLAHVVDACAPGLMLAYGIGRIGCQLAGDGDWGMPNTMPMPEALSFLPEWMWSFDYFGNVNGVDLGAPGRPVLVDGFMYEGNAWPTPFYETIMAFIIFGILWTLRKRLKAAGALFSVYLILNGIERFFIEKIRINDKYELFGMQATQAEIIAVLLVVAGAFGVYYAYHKHKKLLN